MNHDYFVSTGWKMAGMKTLFIIFVIMFPVAMITEEDVNHGGNNYHKNLIAHLRIVAILFQHPVLLHVQKAA